MGLWCQDPLSSSTPATLPVFGAYPVEVWNLAHLPVHTPSVAYWVSVTDLYSPATQSAVWRPQRRTIPFPFPFSRLTFLARNHTKDPVLCRYSDVRTVHCTPADLITRRVRFFRYMVPLEASKVGSINNVEQCWPPTFL